MTYIHPQPCEPNDFPGTAAVVYKLCTSDRRPALQYFDPELDRKLASTRRGSRYWYERRIDAETPMDRYD